MRGSGHVKLYAVDGVIATATSAGFTFLYLGAFNWGIYGYILAIFTSDMLSVLFMFVCAKLWRFVGIRQGLKKDTVVPMLKYCIPLIPTIILWWIINVSDQYMVTYFNGVSQSGIYTAAYKIPNFVVIFASIFIDAWQLSAVDEYDNDGKSRFFSQVFRVYSGALIAVGAVLIAGARIITRLYLGRDYYDSWHYVPILVIATTFSCLVNFYASVYMAEKKSTLSMLTAGAGAVVNIVLNLILIPVLGPYGAAIATAISFVCVFIIRVFNTRQFVEIKINSASFFPSVALMLAECVIMIVSPFGEWGTFGVCAAIMLIIVLVNYKAVKDIIVLLLGKFLKKKKR